MKLWWRDGGRTEEYGGSALEAVVIGYSKLTLTLFLTGIDLVNRFHQIFGNFLSVIQFESCI